MHNHWAGNGLQGPLPMSCAPIPSLAIPFPICRHEALHESQVGKIMIVMIRNAAKPILGPGNYWCARNGCITRRDCFPHCRVVGQANYYEATATLTGVDQTPHFRHQFVIDVGR